MFRMVAIVVVVVVVLVVVVAIVGSNDEVTFNLPEPVQTHRV